MFNARSNRLPPNFNEILDNMIIVKDGIPKISKKLSFDLNKYSIVSKAADCFQACTAMAALYWKQNLPELEINTEIEYWKNFKKDTSIRNIKGISLKGILTNLDLNSDANQEPLDLNSSSPKNFRELPIPLEVETKLQFISKNPETFSDLMPPFSVDIPIIQIAIYDDMFARREITGPSHASLISRVDLVERKITLINPENCNKDNIIIERNMDMKEFARGWFVTGNLVIWVYPQQLEKKFVFKTGSTKIKKIKQEKIYKYIKENHI